MNRFLRNLFYVGSFFAFLFLFFLWTLPYEGLKNRILHQVEDGLNASLGKSYRIKAQKMDISVFTGLTLKNVEWMDRGPEGDFVLLKADRFRVNPSLMSLIFGSTNASYFIEMGKGEVSGSFSDNKKESSLDMDFDDFPLAFLKGFLGLPLSGKVNGTMRFDFNKKEVLKNSGTMDLKLQNLVLENYSIPLDAQNPASAIQLGPMKLSSEKNLPFQASLKGNQLEIKQFQLDGPDLELQLKGKVTLGKSSGESQLNLGGKFKVSDQVVQAVPFFALIEPQKNSDGSFDISLEGRLSSKPLPNLTVGKFSNILNQMATQPGS